MWQEIKVGGFIFALCILAALATVEIYEHASGSTTSVWLLLPVFMLIAIAIFASELLAKKVELEVEADESEQINWAIPTWSPIAGITVAVIILSLPPAPLQAGAKELLHDTGVRFVGVITTDQAIQCTESGTYS